MKLELTPERIKEIARKVFLSGSPKGSQTRAEMYVEAGAKAQTELLAGVTDEEMVQIVEKAFMDGYDSHANTVNEFRECTLPIERVRKYTSEISAIHNARLKQAKKEAMEYMREADPEKWDNLDAMLAQARKEEREMVLNKFERSRALDGSMWWRVMPEEDWQALQKEG